MYVYMSKIGRHQQFNIYTCNCNLDKDNPVQQDKSTMESVTLSHNNVNFTVEVDSETYNKLINDTHYASQYASEVYKALLTNENMEEKQAESNFKWTQSLIRLLVDIHLREEPKFNRPNTKKGIVAKYC